MKIALVTEATAPLPASWIALNEWPFFIAISAATAQHSSSATWIGPSSASSPKSASAPGDQARQRRQRQQRVRQGRLPAARSGPRSATRFLLCSGPTCAPSSTMLAAEPTPRLTRSGRTAARGVGRLNDTRT